jgi:hypothetical protein
LKPQATLEHFLSTARNGEHLRAAHALNLNLIPLSEQAEQAPQLARRLLYLLENRVGIDWERLPDRRDGRLKPSLLQETVLSGSCTDPASAAPQHQRGQPEPGGQACTDPYPATPTRRRPASGGFWPRFVRPKPWPH